ncbi:FAD-dependent oxidoreductase [Curtobacterium sp. MCBD17_013]|uniref:FAD-dependent monooxygenase n=1 Tax=Curtobacterium sp. MCBD17_013 TaxID=2175668 RepID=UPI000DA877F1|nr:FAD-dependent monooxygenase [Curtobacterium sp. MCBD17_013]PZF61525.1 FAD-dependent oxidoreductase [Curtobacterium sp. MCBD17_013]
MTTVLISGASIAGPALAYWLHRYGFDVTVVEQAERIRPGGQAVDFKGPIQMRVLAEMGILDAVRAKDVRDEDAPIVNASGRRIGTAPGAFGAGEVNVPRGDLAQILHERTEHDVEYVFGDSITGIDDDGEGVDVTFRHGAPRRFDLVVGADGIHSNVRRLVFGPEEAYVTHLGHYYVLADIDTGPEDVVYSQPGMTVMLGGGKAPVFLVFASPLLPSARDDVDMQKRQAADALRDGAWRIPEIIGRFGEAHSFYMDSISRVTVDHYARGRTVLLGDAAWGNALGGYGTGLAMVGAYVLAGELHRAAGDPAAFATFERKFTDHASVSRKVNAGRLLAPLTRGGVLVRNLLFSALAVAKPLMRIVDQPASDLTLEHYGDPVPAR